MKRALLAIGVFCAVLVSMALLIVVVAVLPPILGAVLGLAIWAWIAWSVAGELSGSRQ